MNRKILISFVVLLVIAAVVVLLPQTYKRKLHVGLWLHGQGSGPARIEAAGGVLGRVDAEVLSDRVQSYALYEDGEPVVFIRTPDAVLLVTLNTAGDWMTDEYEDLDAAMSRVDDIDPSELRWESPGFWSSRQGNQRLFLLTLFVLAWLFLARQFAREEKRKKSPARQSDEQGRQPEQVSSD